MNQEWHTILATASAEETKAAAKLLGDVCQAGDVIALDGDLGAGKTQFTQGLALGLGIESPVTSPTFNLVEEYDQGRLVLYHFDLYRLEAPEELEDIDFYGITEAGGVSCIEWASKFEDELPDDRLELYIEVTGETSRTIKARPFGAGAALLENWQQAQRELY